MSDVDSKEFFKYDQALKCLSRIRCLETCAQYLNKDLSLPVAIGYAPRYLFMKSISATELPLFKNPGLNYFKNSIRFTSRHVAQIDGNLEFNKDGIWGNLVKIKLNNEPIKLENQGELWLLLSNFNTSNTLFSFLIPCTDADDLIDEAMVIESSWQEMTIRCYLPFGIHDKRAEATVSSANSYANINLPSWTQQHDEQICQLISKTQTNTRDLIESIKVSSGKDSQDNLFTDKPDEVWMPEGKNEQYFEIKLKIGIFIERFGLRLSRDKMQYIVNPIHVSGGTSGNMERLMERPADNSYVYPGDELWLLQKQKTYYQTIRVSFQTSYTGEIQISGLIIIPQNSEIDCFNFFNSSLLSLYPKLCHVDPAILCKRLILLKRVITIYDSCLSYLFPNWNANELTGIIKRISRDMQHLLPLSKIRKTLAKIILEKSEYTGQFEAHIVDINRRIIDKASNENIDPKQSVFYQIYSNVTAKVEPFQYRLPKNTQKWWMCHFINESVSDSGGGFRDSLTNIAEELCPTADSKNEPVFSLFIASPNQQNPDASDSDTYIPNGSCLEFPLYKWIGNIMGASFRTEDNIAFSLPKFFWKMFVGHEVTWKDYDSVDQKEVMDLALMEKLDKTMFDTYFLDTRTWSHTLSDGSSIELKKGGENETLQYEDRLEYIELVKEARLQEFKAQVDALRDGFEEVVPMSVIHLFTLDELEEMICGKHNVTYEELKAHTKVSYSHDGNNNYLELFWKVMETLTDEERSRFLKFASGRKRLPVNVSVNLCVDSKDILPTASTCSSTFHLPIYSSFEKALAMIRYAINSCQTIDTD